MRSPMNHNYAHRSDFVICAILIIALILLVVPVCNAGLSPLFARPSQTQMQAICASNLMHLGSAMKLFAQDNQGKLPLPYRQHPNEVAGVKQWWFDQILPYVQKEAIFTCPNDNPMAPDSNGKYPTYLAGSPSVAGRCSYILRDYYQGRNNAGLIIKGFIPGTSEVSHSDAGSTAVLRCGKASVSFPIISVIGPTTYTNYAGVYGVIQYSPCGLFPVITNAGDVNIITGHKRNTFPHNDGIIYLYMDGHVKWLYKDWIGRNCENQQRLSGSNGVSCLPESF